MKIKEIDTPCGPFYIPTHNPGIEKHATICALNVLEGEYSYTRAGEENVTTLVDIGCNIGAFSRWAVKWWPSLNTIHAYDPNASALEIADRNTPGMITHWAAVTTQAKAQLSPADDDEDNWGGAHTYEAKHGFYVPVVHPDELPPCDVLKVDAEGVELEVFQNYPYLADVRVVMYEYHRAEHRDPIAMILRTAGLTCLRHSIDPNCTQDVCSWVRR